MSLLDNCHIAYVNLASRPDRNEHMIKELKRVGLEASRFDAYEPGPTIERVGANRVQRMLKENGGTEGAIGCMFSQISIMLNAARGQKNAMVLEDDTIFCSDFKERLHEFATFVPSDFDILWLGATFHKEPTWHKLGHQDKLPCNCTLNRDWEETNHPNIVRTYGAWSTYAYIVNKKSIPKITLLLSEIMPQSIGIDYSMIALQPLLKTYAFVPGMVKQGDWQSNIGNGITKFSNFNRLGIHWWADTYDKDKKYI